MNDCPISDRVRLLILNKIPSVLQLEIVLKLYAAGPKFLALRELAAATGLDPVSLQDQLGELQRSGMVASQNTPDPVFAYASSNQEQDLSVKELAEAYQNYRVSVINLIYSRPTERIRTFADAFRIRPLNKEPLNE